MAEFIKPFPGLIPDRPMTKHELIRAIRMDLAAELEATHLYTAHAEATDDKLAKMILQSIAEEEQVHAGEFMRLLKILDPREKPAVDAGREEVNKIACQLVGSYDIKGLKCQ